MTRSRGGQSALSVSGDLTDPDHCRDIIRRTVVRLGRVDVLVSNAAYQMTRNSLDEIPDKEWDHTLATNLSAFFHLSKAVVPHIPAGGSIITTSSVQGDAPSPNLMPYAMTKAGFASMTASLAHGDAVAVWHVGELDTLPGGWQDVAEEQELVVRTVRWDHDAIRVSALHPQILGLTAGDLPVQLREPVQRGTAACAVRNARKGTVGEG
ncbi:SDR family NAD(P)-dependent oxidoreductase [Plantibacter sp. YIM 135249]|uniref:SDR family NAD(P)-dependent oxidoreductase n=1 Tax=Plantibacter sp. YIM 135249 TaxID=3423918 RepID=UPI003D3334FB